MESTPLKREYIVRAFDKQCDDKVTEYHFMGVDAKDVLKQARNKTCMEGLDYFVYRDYGGSTDFRLSWINGKIEFIHLEERGYEYGHEDKLPCQSN